MLIYENRMPGVIFMTIDPIFRDVYRISPFVHPSGW